jgi:hypothetical protein
MLLSSIDGDIGRLGFTEVLNAEPDDRALSRSPNLRQLLFGTMGAG